MLDTILEMNESRADGDRTGVNRPHFLFHLCYYLRLLLAFLRMGAGRDSFVPFVQDRTFDATIETCSKISVLYWGHLDSSKEELATSKILRSARFYREGLR